MPQRENDNCFTLLIVLFIVSLLAFEIIAWDWWRHGPSSQLDVLIFRYTDKLVARYLWINEFSSLAGILGNSFWQWTLIVCGGIFLIRKKDWRAFLFLLLAVVLGNLLVEPVKAWFQRPRPLPDLPGARGFSFPSSSAYLAAVVYGSLAYFAARHSHKRWSKLALFLGALTAALLVGLSRLTLRLHWLTDVLGAYALAGSWLLLNFLVYQKTRKKPR